MCELVPIHYFGVRTGVVEVESVFLVPDSQRRGNAGSRSARRGRHAVAVKY